LERDGIKDVRIECLAQPFMDFGMALVLGIGKRDEHIGIAPWAADIFRRTAPGRLDQAGIDYGRISGRQTFHFECMLPAVAEVIKIA
jgi:hypothetical protein